MRNKVRFLLHKKTQSFDVQKGINLAVAINHIPELLQATYKKVACQGYEFVIKVNTENGGELVIGLLKAAAQWGIQMLQKFIF